MEIVKSAIKCGDCSNVLEKPITLSCGSSVCLKHLQDIQIRSYYCKPCKKYHRIDERRLIVNQALDILIKSNVECLNLGAEYNTAFEICNELDQTIVQIERIINDPTIFLKQTIDTLKNKTELLREEFKVKIDTKADQIIQQLDNYQQECIENFNSSDFKVNINKLNESMMNIKQDLTNWQKILNNLGSNENQWKAIKQSGKQSILSSNSLNCYLKKNLLVNKLDSYVSVLTNFQKIQLESDTRFETEMQELTDILSYRDIKSSKIINETNKDSLLKLCDLSEENWRLIYCASEHGLTAKAFHEKCDNVPNTLTIIKSPGGYIFGGYTSQAWDQSNSFKADPNAFLFSLVNPRNQPAKLNIENSLNAIYCGKDYGPTFGNGFDLCTLDPSSTNYSNLGSSYQRLSANGQTYRRRSYSGDYYYDDYEYDSIDRETCWDETVYQPSYLSKSNYFQILDFEIYQIY